MKQKKLVHIILIIGIILIIIGATVAVYTIISEENKKQKDEENEIIESYNTFKEETEKFSSYRIGTYSEEVQSNLYIEYVSDEYEDWINTLDEYTTLIDNVENSSSLLKEKCVNKTYSNKDVSNKCEAFTIAYETAINYYTKDVTSFNELLASYREEYDDEDIVDYELKYEFIDIDGDGKFTGKE